MERWNFFVGLIICVLLIICIVLLSKGLQLAENWSNYYNSILSSF